MKLDVTEVPGVKGTVKLQVTDAELSSVSLLAVLSILFGVVREAPPAPAPPEGPLLTPPAVAPESEILTSAAAQGTDVLGIQFKTDEYVAPPKRRKGKRGKKKGARPSASKKAKPSLRSKKGAQGQRLTPEKKAHLLERLLELREKNPTWSQRELAEKAGTSQMTVSRLLLGVKKPEPRAKPARAARRPRPTPADEPSPALEDATANGTVLRMIDGHFRGLTPYANAKGIEVPEDKVVKWLETFYRLIDMSLLSDRAKAKSLWESSDLGASGRVNLARRILKKTA